MSISRSTWNEKSFRQAHYQTNERKHSGKHSRGTRYQFCRHHLFRNRNERNRVVLATKSRKQRNKYRHPAQLRRIATKQARSTSTNASLFGAHTGANSLGIHEGWPCQRSKSRNRKHTARIETKTCQDTYFSDRFFSGPDHFSLQMKAYCVGILQN